MSSIAVCISGEIRTFRETHKSIREFIPDADIFIHTWSNSENSWKDTVQGFKLVEQNTDMQELIDIYQPEDIMIDTPINCFEYEDTKLPDMYKDQKRTGWDKPAKHNYLPMYYGILQADLLRRDSGKSYDMVVRTRPDIKIVNELHMYNGNGVYYTPMDPLIEDWPIDYWSEIRANDFFAWGDEYSMECYSERWYDITYDLQEEVETYGNILGSETSLKNYLDRYCIPCYSIFPNCAEIVRELYV